MPIYLNNTYGFIRHGDSHSNTLCLVREAAVWLMFLDVMMTHDRSIGTREAFMKEAASFVPFSDPRVVSAVPTREARGESAGQIRGFEQGVSLKNKPAGHRGLTRE